MPSLLVWILNQVQRETMFRWTIKIANCKYKSGCNGRINAVAINSARHNPFVVIYNNNRMRTEEEEQQRCKTFICIFHMDVLNWCICVHVLLHCILSATATCSVIRYVLQTELFDSAQDHQPPLSSVQDQAHSSQFTAVDTSFLLRPCPTMEVQVPLWESLIHERN